MQQKPKNAPILYLSYSIFRNISKGNCSNYEYVSIAEARTKAGISGHLHRENRHTRHRSDTCKLLTSFSFSLYSFFLLSLLFPFSSLSPPSPCSSSFFLIIKISFHFQCFLDPLGKKGEDLQPKRLLQAIYTHLIFSRDLEEQGAPCLSDSEPTST